MSTASSGDERDVSLCIMFVLDERTCHVLSETTSLLCEKSEGKIISLVKKGSLPYHLTMFGGIRVRSKCAQGSIHYFMQVLRPFQDSSCRPQVEGIEPCVTNGNILAIRYKFKPGTYSLSGDKRLNRMIGEYYCPSFILDQVRHVSIGRVTTKDNAPYECLDMVYPDYVKIVEVYHDVVKAVQFTPSIWKKEDNVWTQVV